ncbi:unnamed protein product [Prorocentrum cordatum]|uniref:SNF2 N-terminal domain-containing protein n=1 Tax=Prorocentrum cordatum TaxID=2364126 RepID=A0ABN9V7B9_9DINO|nr:unnamed protein product [Polarella glacialis]
MREGELADLQKRFFMSNATLVITPPNLFEQWLGEFKKFMAPEAFEKCRIIEIPHIHRLNKLSVEDFANADVVIVPYRFFFSGVYDRYLDETIGRTGGQMDDGRKDDDFQTKRYGILRDFLSALLADSAAKVAANPGAAKETAAGQKLPVDVLERMAPTLEAFYWRRVVFDEFHEVMSIREGRPFQALRQCFAKFHWGLTATPPLGNSRDVADMASLLGGGKWAHLHLAPQPARVPALPRRVGAIIQLGHQHHPAREPRHRGPAHPAGERLLYLHQRNEAIAASKGGKMTFAQEEHLLQLCSHYSPNGEVGDGDGHGATTATYTLKVDGVKLDSVHHCKKRAKWCGKWIWQCQPTCVS